MRTAHDLLSSVLILTLALPAYGQSLTEAPLGVDLTPPSLTFGDTNHPETRGEEGLGAVLGTFAYPDPPIGTGEIAIGLDAFEGNLIGTEALTDFFFIMDTSGALVSPAVSIVDDNRGLIGIADSPEGFWTTNVADPSAALFTADGTLVREFSVVSYSTFPEGIDVHTGTGHIFIADGSGNNVIVEFEPDGTFVATHPVGGSSQDGLAFDPERCSFWLYESGTDSVRHLFFDGTTMTEQESFPGTAKAGFGGGEGVAVIGDSLYVSSASAFATVVEFDISGAASDADNALCQPPLFADGFESGNTSEWSSSQP
ncbi:MAG: hypothetical protein AAF725_09190 [Acidobacteriota bacterium]